MDKRVPARIDRSFLPLDYPISDLAFRLYATLLTRVNDNGEYKGTLDDLGSLCVRKSGKPMNRSSVHRAISELRFYKLLSDNPNLLLIEQQKPYENVLKNDSEDQITVEIPEQPVSLSNEQQNVPSDDLKGDSERETPGSPESIFVVERTTESARMLPPGLFRIKSPDSRLSAPNALLSNEQQDRPNQPNLRDIDVGGDGVGGVDNADPFVHEVYFNNINNINNNTTTNGSSLPQKSESEFEVDAFTKRHFPNSPVSIRYCQMYFEGHMERNGLEYDTHAAALDFLEHWEHKKQWLYQRKRDKFATKVTADRVKSHLSTWGKGIKKGWNVYPVGGDDDGKNDDDFHWMTYQEAISDSQRRRLDFKNYVHNGQKGENSKFRLPDATAAKPGFKVI